MQRILHNADYTSSHPLPDLQNDFLHNAGMTTLSIANRLKLARSRRFKTAKEAAEALGVPYGTYTGHEAGTRGFAEDVERYAKFFRVRPAWLAFEDGPMDENGTLGTTPRPEVATDSSAQPLDDDVSVGRMYVRWTAEAGMWREYAGYTDEEEPESFIVPVMRRDGLRRFLTKIAGDSMDKARLFDGDYVVTIDWNDIERPANDGEIVVVQQIRDGGHTIETTVKQIRVMNDRFELHPRSSNARHKAIIVRHGDGEVDGREVRIIGLVESVFRPVSAHAYI